MDRSHIVRQPLTYSKMKRARRELHKNTLFGYVLILVPKVVGTPRIKSFFDRTRRRRRWSPKVVCGPSVTRARRARAHIRKSGDQEVKSCNSYIMNSFRRFSSRNLRNFARSRQKRCRWGVPVQRWVFFNGPQKFQ